NRGGAGGPSPEREGGRLVGLAQGEDDLVAVGQRAAAVAVQRDPAAEAGQASAGQQAVIDEDRAGDGPVFQRLAAQLPATQRSVVAGPKGTGEQSEHGGAPFEIVSVMPREGLTALPALEAAGTLLALP